ncbi:MAG: PA2169 family four-helix-bundle protein [Bacteroidota bacterium]|nr:PA2169 family four-helix-bundle protein [Bacteroidota bacterium]
MENPNQKIIDKLNHFIAIAEDGKIGYENAAKDVKDNQMKAIFEKYSKQRSGYIEELQKQVHHLGSAAEDSGGPVGLLHRVLMDIKSVLTSGDKNAIINACITGEEAAVKHYTDTLEETLFPDNIRAMIQKQLSGIHQALSEIKSNISAE